MLFLTEMDGIHLVCPKEDREGILELLTALRSDLIRLFPDGLVGLYVYGSLAWGDFDPSISDIDMLAVLSQPVSDDDAERIRVLHDRLVDPAIHPDFAIWNDRIEVQYAARSDLRTFRERPFRMGVISPGEPFHVVTAGREWTTNWYFAQTHGISLAGPSPEDAQLTVPAVCDREFVEAVRDSAVEWKSHIGATAQSRPYQGYAVLTMCRALYTMTFHRQVSKRAAMAWARGTYPEFTDIIDDAWSWRVDPRVSMENPNETFPRVRTTVMEMADMVERIR